MKKRRYLIIVSALGFLFFVVGVIAPSISKFTNSTTLSSADLEYGENELNKMLNDLPEMRQWIKSGNPLWNIAVRQLAGEAIGQRIRWDPSRVNDKSYFASYNSSPYLGKLGSISLQKYDHFGNKICAEELCRHFFFETFNIRNHSRFVQEFQHACFTRTSREDYVRKNAELEYSAIRKISDFYVTIIKPWSISSNITSHPELWNVPLAPTFEAWISQYEDRSGYPWRHWGTYYDKSIAPYQRIWGK